MCAATHARWRVIAILWRAKAGPAAPARAKDPHPPLGMLRRPPKGRVPTLPPGAWSDLRPSDLWLDPGMAAAVPKLLRGPSPFPEDVPYAAIFRNPLSASRPREP